MAAKEDVHSFRSDRELECGYTVWSVTGSDLEGGGDCERGYEGLNELLVWSAEIKIHT